MNKIFSLFILLFFFHTSIFSQNEYIVRCSVNVNAGSCKTCSNKPIGQVTLYEVPVSGPAIPKGNIINSTNYQQFGVWHSMFIKITKGSRVEFRFNDPTGGGNQVFTYNAVPGNTTVSPNHYYHNDGAKRKYHTVYLDAEAKTYGYYDMTNLADYPSGNTDINICVDSPNQMYIQFNIPNGANLSCPTYLCAYTYNGTTKKYDPITRIRLDEGFSYDTHPHFKNGDRYVIQVSQFLNETHLGKDIYFQIETSAFGLSIFNGVQSRSFYRYMPPISTIVTKRSACGNDVINVTLSSSVISSLNAYRFKIREAGTNGETLSNIIPLLPGTPTGNTVPLTIPNWDGFGKMINEAGGNYILQVHGTELEWNDDVSNISCAVTKEFSIPAKPEMLALTSTLKTYTFTDNLNNSHTYHISSYGANDGQATLTLSGGTSGRVNRIEYSYNNSTWQTIPASQLTVVNATTYLFTSLKPGNYKVKVSDTDGCESAETDIGTLVEPAALLLPTSNIHSTLVTCHINNTGTGSKSNATITATWSGGIGPYSAWVRNSSGTTVYTENNITKYSFDTNANLPVGSYSVRITDSQGKYVQTNHTVTSNPELILTPTPHKRNCYQDNSGYVFLSVKNRGTSNVNFSLTGETTKENKTTDTISFMGLSASTYTATVTNTNGCSDVVSAIEVTEPNDIKITATGSKIAKYGGNTGTINLTIEGGTGSFDYDLYKTDLIKSGTTTKDALINGLYAGNYHVDVTDGNSCPKTENDIIVRQPDAPLSLSFTQLNVDCFGNASAEVYPVATGGWGHYQFGFNGTIYGPGTTIPGLVATTTAADTVFVVDSAGVTEKLPVVITEPTQLTTSVKEISHLLCFEDNTGAVELNVSGGTPQYYISSNQLNWLPGSYISGLAANPDQVIYVKDEHECPATVNVVITQPDLLRVSKDTIIDAFCTKNNGGIHTIVNGGTEAYNYQWYNIDLAENTGSNSNILSDIYSGRYKLTVTDAHQCKDSMEFPVSDMDGPKILNHSIDSVSCYNGNDGKINISSVSGGMPAYHYYLNGKETTESSGGLALGTYHIRVVDDKGCKTDEYYTVPQPNDIVISESITQPVCYDSYDGMIETFITGGNGGYAYLWSSGSSEPVLSDENKGNFTLQITDWKGCQKEKSYEIIPPAKPTAGWAENSAVLCTGNVKQLDGGDFVAYQWQKDGQVVSTNRFYTLDEGGTYTLKMTTNLGCTSIDTFKLEISDHPLDAVLLLQDSAQIFELVEVIDVTWPAPDSISWYFDKQVSLGDYNEWSQQFSVEDEGIVNVTLRAWYGGCFSDSAKTITIYSSDEKINEKSMETMPLILGCKLWPNPNNGNFSLEVKLSEVSDITIQVYHLQNHSMLFSGKYKGLKSYEVPFQFNNLMTGIYLVVVKAKGEQQSIKFVINIG